jgi:hypothetical protein
MRTLAGLRKRGGCSFENVAFPNFEKRGSTDARKRANGNIKVAAFGEKAAIKNGLR